MHLGNKSNTFFGIMWHTCALDEICLIKENIMWQDHMNPFRQIELGNKDLDNLNIIVMITMLKQFPNTKY